MDESGDRQSPTPSLEDEERARSSPLVLFPVFGDYSDRSLTVALSLAAATEADLFLLGVDERADAPTEDEHRDLAKLVMRIRTDDTWDVTVHSHVERGSDPVGTVVGAATAYDAGLVVVDEAAAAAVGGLRGNVAQRIAEGVAADAVVVTDKQPSPSIASILVPVAGGPNTATTVRVAAALAREHGAWIELLHIVDTGGDDAGDTNADGDDAAALFAGCREQIPDGVEVQTWRYESDDVADVIVDQSNHYDVTVIGAPQSNRLKRLIFGSLSEEIRSEATHTVLMARRGSKSLFEQ